MKKIDVLFNQIFKRDITTPGISFFEGFGYFITNEFDYDEVLNDITVRGGIHVAVMGGLDPVLGQIAVCRPDVSIVADINETAIKAVREGRLQTLKSETEDEYWESVKNYFRTFIKVKEPNRWDFPNEDCGIGWSALKERFLAVKEAYNLGKIKLVNSDFVQSVFPLCLKLAKKTNNKITLIYVSNIFDYKVNDVSKFVGLLKDGLTNSLIDKNAQIIFTDGKNGLKTKILFVKDYIDN